MTESEEEVEVLEGLEVAPVLAIGPAPPQHMENADVANNNRDWQGNNMEPQEGNELEFEGVMAEGLDMVAALEAPGREEEEGNGEDRKEKKNNKDCAKEVDTLLVDSGERSKNESKKNGSDKKVMEEEDGWIYSTSLFLRNHYTTII